MGSRPVTELPQGDEWCYEIKWDGYRAQAIKDERGIRLLSRRGNSFNANYPELIKALEPMSDNTVRGEVVAFDSTGHTSFSLLQNYKRAGVRLAFIAFDILIYKGEDLRKTPLKVRREYLTRSISNSDAVQLSECFHGNVEPLLKFAEEHGVEGLVAKKLSSIYESDRSTGAWSKYRINQGQEFVIGGFTPGSHGLDAILIGFYRDSQLIFCASVRAGFVPSSRRKLFDRLKPLINSRCPFSNLPERKVGRWGQGITAEKMKTCVWVRPQIVVQLDFLEWTDLDHLRGATFVAIREDKIPAEVVKE